MTTYNKYERVQAIMRYLHKASNIQRHTIMSIAKDTNIPFSSVRKTINDDWPVCFATDPITGGICLSGIYPGDREFDLEPPKVNDGKMPEKYYEAGKANIKSFLAPEALMLLEKILGKETNSTADYYKIWNTIKAIEIMMKIARSKDREKAKALLVAPKDS